MFPLHVQWSVAKESSSGVIYEEKLRGRFWLQSLFYTRLFVGPLYIYKRLDILFVCHRALKGWQKIKEQDIVATIASIHFDFERVNWW